MSKKIVVGGSTLILKREDEWMNNRGQYICPHAVIHARPHFSHQCYFLGGVFCRDAVHVLFINLDILYIV
jgi:hypothetical protein